MNVLVVCQYYRPEPFKIGEICESLQSEGHRVTVLTGLPNYPRGVVSKEYRWGRGRKAVINGVKVIRCFEIGRGADPIRLALNYVSFLASASFRALRIRGDFDVVFVYQLSPVTMAVPGIVAKRRLKKPLLLYSLDLWPESMKALINSEESLLFRLACRASRAIYTECDVIAVTSKPFLDYFEAVHGLPSARMAYLPQHADDMTVTPRTEPSATTNFVFLGNIGLAQDIPCILSAVALLKGTHDFVVHFVGDGSFLESAMGIVRRDGLEELVVFHGRRPVEEMSRYYSLADACLLSLGGDNWVGLTMPSKLQGYMAAGKPVIGAIDGAAREVINEADCGLCVGAGDAVGLAEAMGRFMSLPERHAGWGHHARKYYEGHFTKGAFMQGLVHELEACADRAQRGVVKEI